MATVSRLLKRKCAVLRNWSATCCSFRSFAAFSQLYFSDNYVPHLYCRGGNTVYNICISSVCGHIYILMFWDSICEPASFTVPWLLCDCSRHCNSKYLPQTTRWSLRCGAWWLSGPGGVVQVIRGTTGLLLLGTDFCCCYYYYYHHHHHHTNTENIEQIK